MDTTLVLRFGFDYALLREKNVPHYLASPETYRGEPRKVVSEGGTALFVVNVMIIIVTSIAIEACCSAV